MTDETRALLRQRRKRRQKQDVKQNIYRVEYKKICAKIGKKMALWGGSVQ